jgi:hypothetical protein
MAGPVLTRVERDRHHDDSALPADHSVASRPQGYGHDPCDSGHDGVQYHPRWHRRGLAPGLQWGRDQLYDPLGSGLLTRSRWNASAAWYDAAIDLGAVSHRIVTGHTLQVRLVISDSSSDDMWLAYDTTTYPSRLVVE